MKSELLPLLYLVSEKFISKILGCMEKVEEWDPDMQIMVMSLLIFATR